MTTHRIQDKYGNWHDVSKSTSKQGAYVSFLNSGAPDRLFMPGQFNSKTVEVVR